MRLAPLIQLLVLVVLLGLVFVVGFGCGPAPTRGERPSKIYVIDVRGRCIEITIFGSLGRTTTVLTVVPSLLCAQEARKGTLDRAA